MLSNLLVKLSPFTKYLTIAALVGAFLCGVYLTRMYYKGELAQLDAAYTNHVNKYLERAIELDNEYNNKIKALSHKLVILNEKLNNELSKPDYLCPIPDDGIRMLNDARKATKD